MDTFEVNKSAGALFGTLLFVISFNVIGGGIFSHRAEKPGYDLPSGHAPAQPQAQAKAPTVAPIEERLAKADPKKGEADAKPCQGCHSFENGAGVKIGPPLYGVTGRAKASVEAFDYSSALKSKGGEWTDADLDRFLTKPSAYAPGTKMTFAGVADPQQRADIVAYLHSLSDKWVPLAGK